MTDENWLEAIAKYNEPRGIPDWEHPEKGGAFELAGMLKEFAEKEPKRFANLALRFPSGTDASYFINVLEALKKTAIPPELKVDLVRRVTSLDDSACAKAAVDMLGSISTYPLPQDMCLFIITLAIDHIDLATEAWQEERPHYGGDILINGINTVRGRAAEAIRDLIWSDSRYLDVFLPTIMRIVHDKALSVRSCVASTLIAVASRNAPTAINLFSQLTDADDRLLATGYAEQFILLGLREHFEDLRGYIERMLRSDESKVKQVGGRLASLARLHHSSAEDLAEAALAGDKFTRLGAAGVAENNLINPDCRQWCEAALVRLFDDDDIQVRTEAGRCFWHLWKNTGVPLTSFNPLISAFVKSKAFADEPSMLLHALEDTTQQIPETTLDVCEEFLNKCAAQARDISTGFAADQRTIGTLVFRAYAQFQTPRLQLRALLLIDRMCEEGLHSASRGLIDFDR